MIVPHLVWPNLVLAKLGLAKLGLGQTWSGQTWSWPNLVWPNLVTTLGQTWIWPNLVSPVLNAPRMSLLDHLQTICPTAPMSNVPDFRTPTLQTAQGQSRKPPRGNGTATPPPCGRDSTLFRAQKTSNNHPTWTSWMSGILSNSTACSFNLEVICAAMKDGWPTGTPRTLRPCRAWGNDPGFCACATCVRTSLIAGLTPALFHNFVLPWWTMSATPWNIALREMESHAPTPSTERIVARSSGERLYHVGHTLCACSRREGVLEWVCCALDLG